LTNWFCRERCPCCTYTVWQKHPPDPSITGSLCCPITCTYSILPHLSYLEKSALVVFHHVLPLSFYCSRTWDESWGIVFHCIWWTQEHKISLGQPRLRPNTSLLPVPGHISCRGVTSSGDGGGSCRASYVRCCVLERVLIIKLWLRFRSRHLVLWSLGTYGLRESE
jgi:hypothetical protein